LGWRNPATQVYWMTHALALGDTTVSAQRLDALLRQLPDFERRDVLIAALLESDEGATPWRSV
jgi:hypothetical protein